MTASAARIAIDEKYRTGNHCQIYGLANDLANAAIASENKSRIQEFAWVVADAIDMLSHCARNLDDPNAFIAGRLWNLMVRLDSIADVPVAGAWPSSTTPPKETGPVWPVPVIEETARLDRAMDIEADDRADAAAEAVDA